MTLSKNGYIAAGRFGLGLKYGDRSNISRSPKTWLRNQVRDGQKTPISPNVAATDIIVREIVRAQKPKEVRKEMRRKSKAIYESEMQARFDLALQTQQPFIERLVQFWSNHFTVSYAGKPFLQAIVGAFEREAIRPHVLGKFSDMLIASTQHPAMLIYLDNINSIGPSLRKKGRNRGLNENLAREILELHSLGVKGGYTQEDVLALAKIITGWSINNSKKNGGNFSFIEKNHEPGSFTLLGKKYDAKGEGQGISALKNLARHPSTAHFIATKLVRHFVDDKPPPRAVREIETVFLRSNGDLKMVALALINLKEAWSAPLSKIKTPYDLIVSSMRLVGDKQHKFPFKRIRSSLKLLDHTPFNAPSPAGRSDIIADWISPNAMINRVEWCQSFAQYTSLEESPHSLAVKHIGRLANPDTLLWIERAPSAKEGLALLLASPEWQRR